MIPPTELLPDGWTADDISLTCPHGERREHDGSWQNAPCDCRNPLKARGLI